MPGNVDSRTTTPVSSVRSTRVRLAEGGINGDGVLVDFKLSAAPQAGRMMMSTHPRGVCRHHHVMNVVLFGGIHVDGTSTYDSIR